MIYVTLRSGISSPDELLFSSCYPVVGNIIMMDTVTYRLSSVIINFVSLCSRTALRLSYLFIFLFVATPCENKEKNF